MSIIIPSVISNASLSVDPPQANNEEKTVHQPDPNPETTEENPLRGESRGDSEYETKVSYRNLRWAIDSLTLQLQSTVNEMNASSEILRACAAQVQLPVAEAVKTISAEALAEAGAQFFETAVQKCTVNLETIQQEMTSAKEKLDALDNLK